MATLYKRANPRQQRILKIVEGAVKNVYHHHPDFSYSPALARSIAKRAAGTLTACWPFVLAIPLESSDQSAPESYHQEQLLAPDPRKRRGRRSVILGPTASKRGASYLTQAHPFHRQIVKELSKNLTTIKKVNPDMAAGMVEALRIIDRIINKK